MEKTEGYERLAQFMGTYPELAIFRRYGALNLQNLLYLQAELLHLEDKLKVIIQQDNEDPARAVFTRDWYSLQSSEDGEHNDQYRTMLEIREKLRQYNEALMQQANLLAIQPPSQEDLNFLSAWLEDPSVGNRYLIGLDSGTWSTVNHSDLIALRPRSESDKKFARVATDFLISRFAPILGKRNLGYDKTVDGLVDYTANGLNLFMQVVTAVISSVLLMIPWWFSTLCARRVYGLESSVRSPRSSPSALLSLPEQTAMRYSVPLLLTVSSESV